MKLKKKRPSHASSSNARGNGDDSSWGCVLAAVSKRKCAHLGFKRTQRRRQASLAALLHPCGKKTVPFQHPAQHDGWKPCPSRILGAAPFCILFILSRIFLPTVCISSRYAPRLHACLMMPLLQPAHTRMLHCRAITRALLRRCAAGELAHAALQRARCAM